MKALFAAAMLFPFMLPDFALANTEIMTKTPDTRYRFESRSGLVDVIEFSPEGDPQKLCVIVSNGSGNSVECVDRPVSETAEIPAQGEHECPPVMIGIAPSHQFFYGRPFDEFDKDGDNRISLREFLAEKLLAEGRRSYQPDVILSEEQAIGVFLEDDKDEDGYIERVDWYDATVC